MRVLIWKLVLPLTAISFFVWTKWWMVYTLPVDGPDIIMVGFPLTYAGDGWHTSMSLQIFVLELFVDLLVYFIFWFGVVWAIDKYVFKIRINVLLASILLTTTVLIAIILGVVGANSTNVYFIRRPYDIEVLQSGYKFIWDGNPRPLDFDYKEYERTKNKK